MIPLIFVVGRFIRTLKQGMQDPEFQVLLTAVVAVLVGGTIFYHFEEGWNWLDSLYFCVSTLTTIGFGDFAPASDLSKIFTIVYVFVGIGLIAAFITLVASYRRRYHQDEDDRTPR